MHSGAISLKVWTNHWNFWALKSSNIRHFELIWTFCSCCVHTQCSFGVHFVFTHCSRDVHSTFNSVQIFVQALFTWCSRSVHLVFMICSLGRKKSEKRKLFLKSRQLEDSETTLFTDGKWCNKKQLMNTKWTPSEHQVNNAWTKWEHHQKLKWSSCEQCVTTKWT